MEIEERVSILEKKMDVLVKRLDDISKNPETSTVALETGEGAENESPREYFLKFNPKKDTEKALVAISFLEGRGLHSITINEISNTLKEMREKLPINISDKIQLLDKRALIKQSGQEGKRKCWIVSNTGKEFLRRLQENARGN